MDRYSFNQLIHTKHLTSTYVMLNYCTILRLFQAVLLRVVYDPSHCPRYLWNAVKLDAEWVGYFCSQLEIRSSELDR